MIEIEPFRFPLTPSGEYPDEHRVRLRGDRTGVYQLSRAGAEGWVRDQKYDPIGKYRMVYIEWDATHWSYNGQDNMWAFEDHFEPVKEESVDNSELKTLLEALATKLDDLDGGQSPEDELDKMIAEPDEQVEIDADRFTPVSDEKFLDILRSALGTAKVAESFMLIAVTRTELPGETRKVLVPHVYKADKSEEASVLLGAQVAQVGTMFHQNLAVDQIHEILEREANGRD